MDIASDESGGFIMQECAHGLDLYTGSKDVFVDIGAHVGAVSIYAAAKGFKNVFALEMDKDNFAFLIKNIERNGYVGTVLPIYGALSNTPIQLYGRVPGGSSGQNAIDAVRFDTKKSFGITSCALASFLGTINYLKIDIEGAEYTVDMLPLLECSEYLDMELHDIDFFSEYTDPRFTRRAMAQFIYDAGFKDDAVDVIMSRGAGRILSRNHNLKGVFSNGTAT